MIICKIDLFNLHQTIIENIENKPETQYHCSLSELPDTICNIVNETGDTIVHLYGADTFANKIANDIIMVNSTKYANNYQITIEVN